MSPYLSSTMPGTNQVTRGLPYLHRNWLTAITRLQEMGSKQSTPVHQNEHHDDGQRPSKRRRVEAPDQPPALYESLLPGEGQDTEKSLRIEVLKIAHKDSARVRANPLLNGLVPPQAKDVSDSRARCRISIAYERNGAWVPVHVDSQICTMKTYKNPVGPGRMVRVHLPQPFQVSQDKLVVPREDDVVFGLAKCYSVQLELESVGDPNWPPPFLTVVDSGPHMFDRMLPQREWVLSTSVKDIYNCHRNRNLEVRLAKYPGGNTLTTDYVMDVDVKWAVGPSAKAMMRRLEKDVQPSITVVTTGDGAPEADMGGVNGLTNGVNGTNGTHAVNGVNGHSVNGNGVDVGHGHINGEGPDDLDDQVEEELTPGRTRRRGKQKVIYNLKLLSDQAAGKERRKRANKLGDKLEDPQGDCRVTYLLPAEQYHVDDFTCCLCGAAHNSLSQLRTHLLGHGKYEFDFEPRPRGGYHVSVINNGSTPVRRRIFQLGQPLKPFDIEKYLAGDESWVTSRYGPENDKEPDAVGKLGKRKQPPQKLVPRKKPKTAVVPRTKLPLFDPLSKVQLEPGSVIEPQGVDESWLIQKHRDTLGDFTDVEPHEKEYMKMWDSFILPLHLTSEQYLPRAFLVFVKDKASWLVAVPSRAQEFSKHFQVLYARNAIDEDVIETALEYLDQAREQAKTQPVEEQPASPPKRKLRSGCTVCGKTVSYGPAFLACSNMSCKSRLYHDYCVKDPKISIEKKDDWRCNDCT